MLPTYINLLAAALFLRAVRYQEISLFDFINNFFLATLLSLVASILIVVTKRAHIGYTAKGHAGLEIQSSHLLPTPRIGGIALAAGLFLALQLTENETNILLMCTMVSAIPVFLAGLTEDIGIGASPRKRLLAAMVSSLFMILLTGYSINSGVAPGLDYLLSFAPVAGLFTIFATGAVCHAFNLIDGMNGLAILISILATAAIGAIAVGAGDLPIAMMAAAIGASALGVLLLNYPFGKLFLGDAGAYSLGFFIAWTGVLLMARNPDVSRWSVLLAVFWPFIDTTAAVARRIVKKVPIGAPDKMHFHHVIKRVLDAKLRSAGTVASNPLTTLVMLPLVALPPVLGVVSAQNAALSFLCLLSCIATYFATKIFIIRNFRKVGRIGGKQNLLLDQTALLTPVPTNKQATIKTRPHHTSPDFGRRTGLSEAE